MVRLRERIRIFLAMILAVAMLALPAMAAQSAWKLGNPSWGNCNVGDTAHVQMRFYGDQAVVKYKRFAVSWLTVYSQDYGGNAWRTVEFDTTVGWITDTYGAGIADSGTPSVDWVRVVCK